MLTQESTAGYDLPQDIGINILKPDSKTLKKLICQIEASLRGRNLQELIQLLALIPDNLDLLRREDDLRLIANAFFVLGRPRDAIRLYDILESAHTLNFNDRVDKVFCRIGLNQIDKAKKELNVLLLEEKEHQEKQCLRPQHALLLGELATPLGLDHVFPDLMTQLKAYLANHQAYCQKNPRIVRRVKNLLSKTRKIQRAKEAVKAGKAFAKRFDRGDLNIEVEKKLFNELIDFFPGEVDYKYHLLKLEAISSIDPGYVNQLLEDIHHIQPCFFAVSRYQS